MAFSPPTAPPSDERELISRAKSIAGLPFGLLADRLERVVPPDLKHAKGWVGQLLEAALGATASSRPSPDFEALGVELKTIPVDSRGRPRESTFVCSVDLDEISKGRWETSRVHKKIARVLWIPVEADKNKPLAERKVGSPLLWTPTADDEEALKADWEDLVEMIGSGYIESISAHRGNLLQIRPKAANASARRWGADDEGDAIRTLPRGFYLRRSFTERLLQQHYAVAIS